MADANTVEASAALTGTSGAEPSIAPPGYWVLVAGRLRRDPVTLAVTALLLAIVFMSLAAPWVTTQDPYASSVLRRLKPIGTPGHWLGTDETGRDVWTRLLRRAALAAGRDRACWGLAGDRQLPWHPRGLPGRLGRLAHHARHGRVLRLSVDPARRGGLRHARQRAGELHHRARRGVHPADGAHRGDRDIADPAPRLRGSGTRRRHHHPADHPPPHPRQRARPHPGLCNQPDQPFHHPFGGTDTRRLIH